MDHLLHCCPTASFLTSRFTVHNCFICCLTALHDHLLLFGVIIHFSSNTLILLGDIKTQRRPQGGSASCRTRVSIINCRKCITIAASSHYSIRSKSVSGIFVACYCSSHCNNASITGYSYRPRHLPDRPQRCIDGKTWAKAAVYWCQV